MQRILFVQYGDFREAYQRFAAGGEENYRDQRSSVNFVSSLAPRHCVTTLAFTDENYQSELAPNLYAWGVKHDTLGPRGISEAFEEIKPTHLVLRTPHLGVLREARRVGCWVLPCFADIFENKGLRQVWRNYKMRRALSKVRATCFSNHSLNASRSFVTALGIPSDRVVPWEWNKLPVLPRAKRSVADRKRPTAFFAGALIESKGVGDCLSSVKMLSEAGLSLTLTIAGSGEPDRWISNAKELGVAGQVRFLGQVSNSVVREQMRAHDFVLVPSHHSYPEGLPNVIFEALAARSVLIMSDHPAFRGRLTANQECLVFEAGNLVDLTYCITQATKNPGLYELISQNSAQALENLYFGIEWTELIVKFLDDPADKTGWVSQNSLARLHNN
jgi:glycosyltransferase involved in cell wall biosynthesis